MASSAIAHCLVTTGIGSDVATNQTAISAARVTGIKQTGVIGHFLDFHSASACFHNHIHSLGIHFDDFIHALHEQHDAAAYGDCAAGYAGTGATRSYGH